jgi:preprotein translocase subunit SecG
MLANVLLVLDIIAALILVGLVLIQHGKGADAGAAFGSGASSTVFGARGSQTFLSQATKYTAIAWFAFTMALVYMTRQTGGTDQSVVDSAPSAEIAPAAVAPTAVAPMPTTAAPAPALVPTEAPAAAPTTAPTGTGGG